MHETEKHILVVDDEKVQRTLMEVLLNKVKVAGYSIKISFAEDARDAIKILESQKVHLLLSDNIMPGMKGAELCTFAKNKYPDIVAVLITGTHVTEDTKADLIRSKSMQRCFVKHVQQLLGEFQASKPIDPCGLQEGRFLRAI